MRRAIGKRGNARFNQPVACALPRRSTGVDATAGTMICIQARRKPTGESLRSGNRDSAIVCKRMDDSRCKAWLASIAHDANGPSLNINTLMPMTSSIPVFPFSLSLRAKLSGAAKAQSGASIRPRGVGGCVKGD